MGDFARSRLEHAAGRVSMVMWVVWLSGGYELLAVEVVERINQDAARVTRVYVDTAPAPPCT